MGTTHMRATNSDRPLGCGCHYFFRRVLCCMDIGRGLRPYEFRRLSLYNKARCGGSWTIRQEPLAVLTRPLATPYVNSYCACPAPSVLARRCLACLVVTQVCRGRKLPRSLRSLGRITKRRTAEYPRTSPLNHTSVSDGSSPPICFTRINAVPRTFRTLSSSAEWNHVLRCSEKLYVGISTPICTRARLYDTK